MEGGAVVDNAPVVRRKSKGEGKDKENVPPPPAEPEAETGKAFHPGPLNVFMHPVVPVLAGILAVASIGGAIYISRAVGHLPENLPTPPISLAVLQAPERLVYMIGLCTVSVIFFCMVTPYFQWLEHNEPDIRLSSPYWIAVAGFVGLAVQSIIPLQEDILEIALGNKDGGQHLQSIVHQAAAGVFFMTTMLHGQKLLDVHKTAHILSYKWKEQRPPRPSRGEEPEELPAGDYTTWSLRIKQVALGLMVLPAVASFFLHPGTHGKDPGTAALNVGGLTQWFSVGAAIVLYLTYSLDFAHARAVIAHNKGKNH